MKTKQQIIEAARSQNMVRVYREDFGRGWASGYVVATGPAFFALEYIDDSIRFDGFKGMRYADVTRCVVPDPHWRFVEKALRLRGLSRAADLKLDLASVASLLKSAATNAPLVTVHLEVQDPGCCYIGRVKEIAETELQIVCVTPDGEWEDEPDTYALDQITRVEFGGAYEAALHLVARAP